MKVILSCLIRWAWLAGTRDSCPALGALVGPLQNIFSLTFTSFVPIAQQAGQAVVPRRQSLIMFLGPWVYIIPIRNEYFNPVLGSRSGTKVNSISLSLRLSWNSGLFIKCVPLVSPKIMGQSKIFFLQCLTIYEKVQISKSEPKKFSFLCTFKGSRPRIH